MDRDRRAFVAQLSALSAALSAAPALSGCRRERAPIEPPPPAAFAGEALGLLEQLVDHVLPADHQAGALAAGCAPFIGQQMARPEFKLLRTVLERGLQVLGAEAARRGGNFGALTPEQRDEVLRAVQQTRRRGFDGQRFVHLLVVLTLEGFLSDPRHGGNRGGVGWQVIGFSPVRWAPADDRAWKERQP